MPSVNVLDPISIVVVGDSWCNRDEVVEEINKRKGAKHLVFKVNTEGPSLWALGIVDGITAGCRAIGIPTQNIWIDQWHNTVEIIPFRRAYKPLLSHFFWMSDSYRHMSRVSAATVVPLAFFVGRLTLERAAMLWHVVQNWSTQVLVSLMRQSDLRYFNENLAGEPWIDSNRRTEFMSWIKSCPVVSITGHSVRDQYVAGNNTNRDLVAWYNHFHVELVSETYCLGQTFFPTEKTVRPISQGKSIIVYGPKNFLSKLRDLGFLTWGDLWDESYDRLEGHDRWQSIKTVIHDLFVSETYLDPRIQQINQHNLKQLNDIITKYKPL